MAQIQWYPGHMHKAIKEISETLSDVDVFIELLDARIPFSSQNPMLNELRGAKPSIKLLTKSDLADPVITKEWVQKLSANNDNLIQVVTTKHPHQIKQLTGVCAKMFQHRDRLLKQVTAMVVGIPNVGKSTIINILSNRSIAKTGDEAAITKMQQRIPLSSGVVLLDTPGVLWPKVENPQSGYRLAATGAIKDTAYTHEDVSWFLAQSLMRRYPDLIRDRYKFSEETDDPMDFLHHIGRQRGCLKSGARIDIDRVSKILINEFRSGAIGAITLETPQMIEQEWLEVERLREEKAEKKAQRKQKWKKSKR